MKSTAQITAIGTYVPERKLTNFDLEEMVETNDEWIVQRTGMKERRISSEDEFTSDLCIAAVRDLKKRYSVDLSDVDLIIVSTTTPDIPMPSVASQIQRAFDIVHTGAIDLGAACAGFVYALNIANGLITSGLNKKVLVIAGEALSKVTDYKDRNTCILFGDGAGAVLVEHKTSKSDRVCFEYCNAGSNGYGLENLYRSGLATRMNGIDLLGEGNVVQNGRHVFKYAVHTLVEEVTKMVDELKILIDDIDWFVPHSANLRIIEYACKQLDFPVSKTLFSATYYGNTSSASIPLAIDIGMKEGKIREGDLLLLFGFGGGYVHANSLIRWSL